MTSARTGRVAVPPALRERQAALDALPRLKGRPEPDGGAAAMRMVAHARRRDGRRGGAR